MALYEGAVRTTGIAVSTPCLEIIASATVPARLLELGLTNTTAVSNWIAFGRPQAIGVTPTTPVAVIPEDQNGPVGNTESALAWGTAPTGPLYYIRRTNTTPAVGAGVVWTFPRGLIIAVRKTVILFNLIPNGALDVWFVVDE